MQEEKKKSRWPRIAVTVCVLLLIPLALLLSRLGGSGGSAVRIHEILGSNSAYPDPTGQYRDFIELYNPGPAPAELGGCGLSDSGSVKYRFPEDTVLAPGAFLVVWCDSAAEDPEQIAPFAIAKEGGETISLLNPRGRVTDRVETIAMQRNQSMIPENGSWVLCDRPTPGFENTEEGYSAYLAARSAGAGTVRFSEFMSSNSLYPAPDGSFRDWVELQNTGDRPVALDGWGMSDDGERVKYYFPAGESIPPHGELVVWCAPEENGFSLSRDGGESLCLLGPNGELADRVETPALEKNRSCMLGENGWETTQMATPGFPNNEDGFEAYLASHGWLDCPVVLNEAMAENRGCLLDSFGSFSDWIELHNDASVPVELTGYWLSDDPETPEKWQIPALTLAPEEYVLVWCDERNTVANGELHTDFSLSRYGETVVLSTPVGSPVSSLGFASLEPDCSVQSSGGQTDSPSPGFPNTPEGELAFLASRETPRPLAINELMTSNSTLLRQPDGRYYDWVELQNTGDTPLRLSDYALSDSAGDPGRFRLPERELAPGEFLLVILSGGATPGATEIYAPFALNGSEDWLYLSDRDGRIVDYLHAAGLPAEGSIGRCAGENGFLYFPSPSPGRENGTGYRDAAPPPEADLASGIYEGVESLTVSLRAEGEIRYTTDGSVPTQLSPLYEGPLTLTKTTPLRARCFVPGSLPSETVTCNYIVNESSTLPIVCLDLPPADFSHIYNGSMRGEETGANISLIEAEGAAFSRDCGLTLHGASSRTLFTKRSMKALFRTRYGGELDYDVFGDGETTAYDSITVRGGTMENSYALVRDAICTHVAMELTDNVLPLKLRYCTLYVNGNYWGIYVIREAYSEKYCANRLGVREEDIRISRAPVAYTINHDLDEKIVDLNNRGAKEPERYDEIAEWLDMDSLVDWMIIQAYFTNTDVPGNVRYIYSAADGKWRYALFDLDNSLMSDDPSWSFVFDVANECGIIPRKMVQNPIFLDKLLTRMAEWLSGPLNDAHVREVMDAYYALLEPEWPKEAARWGSYGIFESSHRALTNYLADGRGQKLIRNLARDLRLDDSTVQQYFGDILQ